MGAVAGATLRVSPATKHSAVQILGTVRPTIGRVAYTSPLRWQGMSPLAREVVRKTPRRFAADADM